MSAYIARLIVQLQGAVVQTLTLNMPVLRIGRTPENGLMLDDHKISRNHAEIRQGSQGATLTDLGSSNGTFIGDQRLPPQLPYLLTDGTSFRIGSYLLFYRTSEVGLPETDEPAPPPTELPTLPAESGIPAEALAGSQRAARPAGRTPERRLVSMYTRYLPDIYQENDFLQRFLCIFEDIWEPLEQRQDHIALYFDPRTCPVSFLPWLASWLDIPLNTHWPESRQRRLLEQAMELYSWRGTGYGLARMIEICTGLTPKITEKPDEPFVFSIRITFSSTSRSEGIDRALLEELIQAHKPAHAGYRLEIVS